MNAEPSRDEIDELSGSTVLEFGAEWCSICRGARRLIDLELEAHPSVRYLRIEDGKGQPLGRSFRVKLWPTLVFIQDGKEVARVVRPTQQLELTRAFQSFGSR